MKGAGTLNLPRAPNNSRLRREIIDEALAQSALPTKPRRPAGDTRVRGVVHGDEPAAGDFLPDLCRPQAVLALVLVGELLALVLVVADSGLRVFDWDQLALTSFLVQWVVLASAALLCPLRAWLGQRSPQLAGSLCYGLVLGVTVLFSVAGQWVLRGWATPFLDVWQLGGNVLVAAVFAGIVLRYFYLQQQLNNQMQAELQARIQALQSRIRPHFLFNSMNSIASLITTDPDMAERVVEDLSDLFRSSLAEPALVPLADELDVSRHYMNIEQLRLGSRLKVDWQIGEYPAATLIPSLLLQPLLENAIYHGIQPRPEGGTVVLSIQPQGAGLEILVSNPTAQASERHHQGNRVALDNIRNRLAAHFGPAAHLVTEQGETSFVARIHLPLGDAS